MWAFLRNLFFPKPLLPAHLSAEQQEGWKAYEQGTPRGACPYVREQPARDWRAGWDGAEDADGSDW